jgi:thiol-disulfide isomerase/thioredoxin
MRKLFLILLLLSGTLSTKAQHIGAYSINDVIHRSSSKDTLYIINFWATWCAPCVAELPEFNKLAIYYEGQQVKILMVSLDFKEDHTFKLERFLERKKLTPEVVWLSDTDPNVFIPKVDDSWQGSIPATVIIHPGKRFKKFIEGSITEKEVTRIVDKVLQSN